MEFTEEKKKEVEKMIVDTCIDAIGAGVIKEEELQLIAQFVLAKIDAITTQEALMQFFEELAGKWQFFLPIERFLEAEATHAKEQKYIDEAEVLAKQGSVDAALAAIKQAGE